jgi:hypothetical protein
MVTEAAAAPPVFLTRCLRVTHDNRQKWAVTTIAGKPVLGCLGRTKLFDRCWASSVLFYI